MGWKIDIFQSELKPIRKVPNATNLDEDIEVKLDNLTIPLRNKTHYEPDPVIKELNVKLPLESHQKFYKLVQNTEKPKKIKGDSSEASFQTPSTIKTYSEQQHYLSNSDEDESSAELEEEKKLDDEPDMKKSEIWVDLLIPSIYKQTPINTYMAKKNPAKQ